MCVGSSQKSNDPIWQQFVTKLFGAKAYCMLSSTWTALPESHYRVNNTVYVALFVAVAGNSGANATAHVCFNKLSIR